MPENPTVQLQAVEPFLQGARRAGDVLQQFRIGAEADQERDILLLQHAREERGACAPFGLDQIALAARDIDQQADRERKISFTGEVLDRLRRAVFGESEVALFEIADQSVLLVPNRAIEVHDIDVDFDRFAGVILRLLRAAEPADGSASGTINRVARVRPMIFIESVQWTHFLTGRAVDSLCFNSEFHALCSPASQKIGPGNGRDYPARGSFRSSVPGAVF